MRCLNKSNKAPWLLFVLIVNLNIVNGKFCSEIDVRNHPEEFESRLRNCSIVIGSVSIVLFDNFREFHFNNISFPELKEITGYLLIFRVGGLKTLRDLFPNLEVIRGEQLIKHYALVIYEMNDLVEIGLTSLVKILRGYVMIRYCPMLCYAHTEHVDSGLGNYVEVESSSAGASPTTKSCPKDCPRRHCWNNKSCQLYRTGYSLTKRNVKCHSECVGSCIDSSPSGCVACRNYLSLELRMCVPECPETQFQFSSSLCVNADFCIRKHKKPFLGECREECPPSYVDTDANGKPLPVHEPCKKCDKLCNLKECPAFEVDSLSSSEYLRGCQVIKGDIYIRLQFGVADTMEILERNLGDIEEIYGKLKIYRSSAITSLSFLRSLHTIHGKALEDNKYSLIIMNNDYLQKLWDFSEKKSLRLINGNLLVHYNSKLCLTEIHELQRLLKTNITEDFISNDSNGYEEICSAQTIKTNYNILSHSSVEIQWEHIEDLDAVHVVGYVIYYIVAPERNITHLGIDTCVQYGWQTLVIENSPYDPKSKLSTVTLTNLLQYTQYAYYVKTQDVQRDHDEDVFNEIQGQSNIMYFTTNPDVPTCPIVETYAKTVNSITLNWYSAVSVKEQITLYRVDKFSQPDMHEFLGSRNFCIEPRVDGLHMNPGMEVREMHKVFTTGKSCEAEYEEWRRTHQDVVDPDYEWRKYRSAVCKKLSTFIKDDRQTPRYEENRREYCNSDDRECNNGGGTDDEFNRFSRQIKTIVKNVDKNENDEKVEVKPKEKMEDNEPPKLGSNFLGSEFYYSDQNNATITDLLPYTVYVFQFFSCNSVGCSSYYFHFERTEALASADTITDFLVVADPYEPDTVHLDFSEPVQPNGLTVAFEIETNGATNSTIVCITRKSHYDNGKRYTIEKLKNGYYGFRVRSISLAMVGDFTEFQYVLIPRERHSVFGAITMTVLMIILLAILGVGGFVYFNRHLNWRLILSRSMNLGFIRNTNFGTTSIQNLTEMDDMSSVNLTDQEIEHEP